MKQFRAQCSTDLETFKSLQYELSFHLLTLTPGKHCIQFSSSNFIVEYNEHIEIFPDSLPETPETEENQKLKASFLRFKLHNNSFFQQFFFYFEPIFSSKTN